MGEEPGAGAQPRNSREEKNQEDCAKELHETVVLPEAEAKTVDRCAWFLPYVP
jgi:hypothetical protein